MRAHRRRPAGKRARCRRPPALAARSHRRAGARRGRARLTRVGIIGAGAWGTALAVVAARGGPVTLWARSPELAAAIAATRANPRYLPGAALPPGVIVTADLSELTACDALVAAVPAQHQRAVLAAAAVGTRPLLVTAKGLEAHTALFAAEVAAEACPDAAIALLTGPTFAHEVAAGLPAAAVVAAPTLAAAALWTARLGTPAFRLYASDDLAGAGAAGVVKNVLAVAAGAVAGAGLGANAAAALIARGLAETARYAVARGGTAATVMGLAGVGDIVLTCGSDASRNHRLGHALGRGATLAAALAALAPGVAEGAATAPVLLADADRRGVDMPIAAAVGDLIAGRTTLEGATRRLLERPARHE